MSGGRREGQRGTQGAYAAIQTRRHLDLFIRVRLPAVRGGGRRKARAAGRSACWPVGGTAVQWLTGLSTLIPLGDPVEEGRGLGAGNNSLCNGQLNSEHE